MKKRIGLFLIGIVLLVGLTGCGGRKYSPEDYIGKTSAQIAAEYGVFDCCGQAVGADGLYRSTACGYTIRAAKRGFLGTDPEWLVFIQFDENGVAYATYEGYRPGG